MNKLVLLLVAASALIVGCLIYLVNSGVSVRPHTLIKPTAITETINVPEVVFQRLFPVFKESEVVLVGLPPNKKARAFLMELKSAFERLTEDTVQLVPAAQDLEACEGNCWFVLPPVSSNELSDNPFIEKYIRPLKKNYFNLTLMEFDRDVEVPTHCEEQQHLSWLCLRNLSVSQSKRKFKTEEKHFFLKQYKLRDYFLFIEK